VPIDQSVVLAVGIALIAAVAGVVAWATATAARSQQRQEAPSPHREDRHAPMADAPPRAGGTGQPRRSVPGLVTPGSARQVARVVAFLFLSSVALVVAITRAWPEAETAIFALIATGVLLVVLFMDMLPSSALGRWRHPIEGLGAIGLLGLLMALTGGIGSPFVVGFYLVVAGTALSAEGLAPLAIALVAAFTVAAVGILTAGSAGIDAAGLAWIGVNAVGLVLVADLSAAAARAQRLARDEALRASRFDALTGLFNRAFFVTVMEQEIRRSERMDRGFAVLMLDLDDLKPVNDTFGHQWGDRLIKAVADVLRQTIRFTDAAARYGGDEFIVLLPETDASGAYIVAETLRRDIASLTLRASERNVRSSVSVGLVTYPQDGVTIEQLVAAADVAMYEAKRRGKNQIAGYRTRTERVATAIDVAASALVGMGPGGPGVPARVGGDTAPWGAGPPASATDHPSATDRPSARASQPSTPPPAASGGDAGIAAGSSPSTAPASQPTRSSASEPTDVHGPGPSNDAPAWLTRPQPPPPATSATVASAAPTSAAGAAAVQPDDNAGDASQQAHLRSTTDRRTGTRDPSRSEGIRRAWDSTAQRPWIALPIDRLDAPDPSDPQAGQVDPPH
jgi:diguanylate cyclase (GGDEF)-like protein